MFGKFPGSASNGQDDWCGHESVETEHGDQIVISGFASSFVSSLQWQVIEKIVMVLSMVIDVFFEGGATGVYRYIIIIYIYVCVYLFLSALQRFTSYVYKCISA